MTRIDMKQTLKSLYRQSSNTPSIVDVSELLFLMVCRGG